MQAQQNLPFSLFNRAAITIKDLCAQWRRGCCWQCPPGLIPLPTSIPNVTHITESIYCVISVPFPGYLPALG